MPSRPGTSRRTFLARAAWTGLLPVLAARRAWTQPAEAGPSGWALADEILHRIHAPVFPRHDFPITRFGARADGLTDATDAIREAIAACAASGGGRVVVPPGRFLTGAIRLKSVVNLHLEAGSTLLFQRAPSAYLPVVLTRYEGTELFNYSPFIYALDEHDVGITGTGTLDGQADNDHWWAWARGPLAPARTRLIDQADRGVPVSARVFGDGSFLRPNFIQPYHCQNVLIEGVTIVNSPMWEIHPVLSRNVIVRGVTIQSHGPNNDGCDPESCTDVLIERCVFDTGDDCIALKSGKNADGRRLGAPIENVIIRDCQMRDGHGGVTVGSEISGGARHIFATRCRMDSAKLDRAFRFKNNSVRGGVVEHVYFRDIAIGHVSGAILDADDYYDEGDAGPFPPVLRDVEIRNVTSRRSGSVLRLRGYARSPIEDIRIVDCRFDGVAGPDLTEGVRGLTLTRVRVNGAIENKTVSS